MKISIIIPAYNRSRLIGLTLDSFIKQNFEKENFEIIVADNNSTDDTGKVVNDFIHINKDYKIKYFVETRQGVHYARNSAAKLASGEFLYFTDDDMIADPNLLTELLKVFSLDEKIATATGVVLPKWEVEPPSWILKLCNNQYLSLNNPKYDLLISEHDCNIFSCHQMIKRELFFACGGYNPENTMGEWIGDGETGLNIKIKEIGYKFAFTRKSVTQHIIPSTRLTQKYLNKRLSNQGNCDCYTYFRKHKPSGTFLAFENSVFFLKMILSVPLSIFYFSTFNVKWRLSAARCFYFAARIKYNSRLKNNPEWRKLVLKMNWIEE